MHKLKAEGRDVNSYVIYLDRVCDIRDIVESSFAKFSEMVAREDFEKYIENPLTEDTMNLLKEIFR